MITNRITADHSEHPLLESYVNIWVNQFGQATNPDALKFWNDALHSFDRVYRCNKDRQETLGSGPKQYQTEPTITDVLGASTGSGKSTIAKHYLANMQDDVMALVVVSRIEDCNDIEYDLNNAKGTNYCQAVHSLNKRDLYETLNKAPRVLVITHASFTEMVRSEATHKLYNTYNLIIIDEEITVVKHIDYTAQTIHSKILPLLDLYEGTDEYRKLFKDIQRSILILHEDKAVTKKVLPHMALIAGDTIGLSGLLKIIKEQPPLMKLDSTMLKFKDSFEKALVLLCDKAEKTSYFYKDSAFSSWAVFYQIFPKDISKVILDANAMTNEVYKLYQENNLYNTQVATYSKIRTYSNATLSVSHATAGKTSLRYDSAKQNKKALEHLLVEVKRINRESKGTLVIMHQDNREDFEEFFKDDLEALKEQEVSLAHWWGDHKGTNKYKDYSNIVIYGLPYMHPMQYATRYLASHDKKKLYGNFESSSIKASIIASDVIQGLNRIALRKAIDDQGNCPEGTKAFILLPDNKDGEFVLQSISEAMGGIKIDQWDFKPHKKVTKTQAKQGDNLGKLVSTLIRMTKEKTIVTPKDAYEEAFKDLTSPRNTYRGLVSGGRSVITMETLAKHDIQLIDIDSDTRLTYEIPNMVKSAFMYRPF